jgi:hypothetical protein
MFRVEDHGSIVLIRPLTDDVAQWLDRYVDHVESNWYGNALVVEPRYVGPIVTALIAEGYAAQ